MGLPSAAERERRLREALDALPRPGDSFAGFAIGRELGRGAFGRVYLARQGDLADRPVALKVAPDLAGETRVLARLQHTHIVPIYSVHKVEGLQAICMPYLGGTTLSDVCDDLSLAPVLPHTGSHLASTLRQRHGSTAASAASKSVSAKSVPAESVPEVLPAAAPVGELDLPLAKLEGMSYVAAVLWMGARLADALAHAHERGVVHRDVKPSNILLADDGRPMLLDFNLAVDLAPADAQAGRAGGTLPYMSPEQLETWLPGRDKKAVAWLDGRTDVFSLGVVLYRLLTGRHPYPVRSANEPDAFADMRADRLAEPPPLRRYNPDVTAGVESIVRTCLRGDRDRRYPGEAELRDDIERHLAHRPLAVAPESVLDRVRKWARRNPSFVSAPALGLAAAIVILGGTAVAVSQSLAGRDAARRAELEAARGKYADFRRSADEARARLAAGDPEQAADGVRRAIAALDRYGAADGGDWSDRPEVQLLPDDERIGLHREAGELAFLLARAVAATNADYALRLNARAADALGDAARPAAEAQRASLAGKDVYGARGPRSKRPAGRRPACCSPATWPPRGATAKGWPKRRRPSGPPRTTTGRGSSRAAATPPSASRAKPWPPIPFASPSGRHRPPRTWPAAGWPSASSATRPWPRPTSTTPSASTPAPRTHCSTGP